MKLKLEDLGEITSKWIQGAGNEPLLSYFKRGYFQSKSDVQDLHSSYSPYRVPRGLTKLQVRRRINKFVRNGRQLDDTLFNTNRVSILFNDTLILGASVKCERPKNSRQMNKLLRGLLAIGTARKRPMPKGFF